MFRLLLITIYSLKNHEIWQVRKLYPFEDLDEIIPICWI